MSKLDKRAVALAYRNMSPVEIVHTKFEMLRPVLDERQQRTWAATEALTLGWGGKSTVSRVTGLNRTTLYQGIAELDQLDWQPVLVAPGAADPCPRGRSQAVGGARPNAYKRPKVLRLCQKMSLVKLDHVALDGAKLKANATRGGYVTELMCLQGGLLTGRPRTGAAIVIYSEAMVIKRSAPKSVILRHLRPPRNDWTALTDDRSLTSDSVPPVGDLAQFCPQRWICRR